MSRSVDPKRAGVPKTNPLGFREAAARFACPAGALKRKVQILRPPAVMSRNTYSAALAPPLGPAYLAGALKAGGYDVDLIDAVGADITRITPSACGRYNVQGLTPTQIVDRIDPNCLALGVSMMFSQEWPYHRELLHEIRSRFPGLVIVAGGEHSTALAEHVLQDSPAVDVIVMGEGEITFLELVSRLANGQPYADVPGIAFRGKGGTMVGNGLSARVRDVGELPRPAWDLCDLQPYFSGFWTMGIGGRRTMPVLATRGCPYRCSFCSSSDMWTTRYLMRPPEDVVDEIAELKARYSIDNVDFYDLTAIVKRDWILAFCKGLRERGVDVTWQLPSGTRSEALDAAVLSALKENGCHFLVYSPESGAQEVLDSIHKHLNLENTRKSIVSAARIGLSTKCNFVIGFPTERRRDIWKSVAYAWSLALRGVRDCNFSIFTPYPGSDLFRSLQDVGDIDISSQEYFIGLLQQFDLTVSKSYNKRIVGRELAAYRLLGIAGFYALSYGVHPWWLLNVFRILMGRKTLPDSLFEQRLMDMKARNGD